MAQQPRIEMAKVYEIASIRNHHGNHLWHCPTGSFIDYIIDLRKKTVNQSVCVVLRSVLNNERSVNIFKQCNPDKLVIRHTKQWKEILICAVHST